METRPPLRLSLKDDQAGIEFRAVRELPKISAKATIRSGKTAAGSFESSAARNKTRDAAIHRVDFLPSRNLRYARKLASTNSDISRSFTEESQATFSV